MIEVMVRLLIGLTLIIVGALGFILLMLCVEIARGGG